MKVMCCFWGEALRAIDAVHIAFCIPKISEESQEIFSHPKCLKALLYKNVPTLLDIDDDADN